MLSRIARRYLEPSTAKYTAAQNLDLYASVFGVKRRNQFGDFNQEAMCKAVSKSLVFSGIIINVQTLET